MNYSFSPIGVVHSCFKEKFGVPRQPGLAIDATGIIEFYPEFSRPEAVRGLEEFSHIWVVFLFHHAVSEKWRPTVRPPRLGGNQRVGVFATRSPFRPNHIGLSVCKLENIDTDRARIRLHVSGIDLIEGTPVLDVKPYLKYVDAIPNSHGGFADEPPSGKLRVEFIPEVYAQLKEKLTHFPRLITLIEQLLALDPRPAYRDDENDTYGMRLYDFNLRWRVSGSVVLVVELQFVD